MEGNMRSLRWDQVTSQEDVGNHGDAGGEEDSVKEE